MKYRVIEKDECFFVQEKETGETDWYELLDEEDNVLFFSTLQEAKEFCKYLKDINKNLNEEKTNVLFEI